MSHSRHGDAELVRVKDEVKALMLQVGDLNRLLEEANQSRAQFKARIQSLEISNSSVFAEKDANDREKQALEKENEVRAVEP